MGMDSALREKGYALQRLHDDLKMNPIVLQIAGWMGYMIERYSPIEFEPGTFSRKHVPAETESYARERLRIGGVAS